MDGRARFGRFLEKKTENETEEEGGSGRRDNVIVLVRP